MNVSSTTFTIPTGNMVLCNEIVMDIPAEYVSNTKAQEEAQARRELQEKLRAAANQNYLRIRRKR